MMRRWRSTVLAMGALAVSCATASCSSHGDGEPSRGSREDTGDLGLRLQVGGGITIASASYIITGSGGFAKSGTIDLSSASMLGAIIGGLPAGTGYTINLTATATDGTTTCAGSASFSVIAGAATSVAVFIECHQAPATGSIGVNGVVNICPVVDELTATPSAVVVGGTISLSGVAHDADKGPAALSYVWKTSAGTLSSATGSTSILTCTAPGDVTITLTPSDGDPKCADARTATVTCTAVGPAPDAGAPHVVINEVESSGGVPGDWAELFNAGTAPADVSGWKFKDNDDTHAFYVIPAGTIVAPGAYFLLEEAQFVFGLGAADSARLFDAAEVLVDSFSWTAHATTTYGRCPNGTGTFATTATVTKGSANDCGSASDAGAASDAGETGVASDASDGGVSSFPWPGTDSVVTVDDLNTFGTNLSGLNYQPASGGSPAVLWAVQNGPSKIYRLLFDGTTWKSDTANDWTSGKLLHYTTGIGAPDSEGISKAEWTDSAIYVSTERDNNNNGVSRLAILRFDTSAAGAELTATNDWNVTADLPVVGANLGLEAITYVPDTALVAGAFFDEATHATYNPANYTNHGTGLFFVGLEGNGSIYAYALDHVTNGFTRVATLPSGQVSIMDLAYDREVGYLWGYCDNTCGNKGTIFRIDGNPMSATAGRFTVSRVFDRPGTLPNSNNEGITFAPEAECSAGQKAFFWSDDDQIDGHAIRRGSIACGAFLPP